MCSQRLSRTTGPIGIGTPNPAAALDIETSSGYQLKIGNGSNGMYWWGQGFNDIDAFGAPLRLYSATRGLQFRTGGADPAVMIANNGSVGIGTANPQQLLDVAGAIAAKEIIVTQSGADYVFHPGYHLAPLSAVDDYIKQYHHLPDIPSAEEMK